MAVLVALTGLQGEDVRVNPDDVLRLVGIPTRQLALLAASGVSAGTYIYQQDSEGEQSTPIGVQGTVAATAAALAASGSTMRAVAGGIVSGAGALQAGSVGIASAVRTALGRYTVTLSVAPTAPAFVSLTPTEQAMISQDGPLTISLNVRTANAAGADADAGFTVLVFGS